MSPSSPSQPPAQAASEAASAPLPYGPVGGIEPTGSSGRAKFPVAFAFLAPVKIGFLLLLVFLTWLVATGSAYLSGDPMFVAAKRDSGLVIRFLIWRGEDPNKLNKSQASPLDLATLDKSPSAMPALLEAGADPHRQVMGHGMLHEAALRGFSEGVELLLEYGLDPSAPDPRGETPIALAAFADSVKSAEALLRAGAASAKVNPDRVRWP